jgi:hypothetical protein
MMEVVRSIFCDKRWSEASSDYWNAHVGGGSQDVSERIRQEWLRVLRAELGRGPTTPLRNTLLTSPNLRSPMPSNAICATAGCQNSTLRGTTRGPSPDGTRWICNECFWQDNTKGPRPGSGAEPTYLVCQTCFRRVGVLNSSMANSQRVWQKHRTSKSCLKRKGGSWCTRRNYDVQCPPNMQIFKGAIRYYGIETSMLQPKLAISVSYDIDLPTVSATTSTCDNYNQSFSAHQKTKFGDEIWCPQCWWDFTSRSQVLKNCMLALSCSEYLFWLSNLLILLQRKKEPNVRSVTKSSKWAI